MCGGSRRTFSLASPDGAADPPLKPPLILWRQGVNFDQGIAGGVVLTPHNGSGVAAGRTAMMRSCRHLVNALDAPKRFHAPVFFRLSALIAKVRLLVGLRAALLIVGHHLWHSFAHFKLGAHFLDLRCLLFQARCEGFNFHLLL